MRALSANRFAALSEAQPGDICLALDKGVEQTVQAEAVYADSEGNRLFQTNDGRVFDQLRLAGQLGALCTVTEEDQPEALDFDRGPADEHLNLPVTARLFGLTLEESGDGYSTRCPFCEAASLLIYRRRGLWLFTCKCGKQGDILDFVGWLVSGDQWSPDGDYLQMADVVLTEIHARLAA